MIFSCRDIVNRSIFFTGDAKKEADSSQLIGKIMPIVENVLSVSYELTDMSSKIRVLRGGSNLIPTARQ
jgi:hypothetical protein